MNVRQALITAANPHQRSLPLQILIDRDGVSRSALEIVLREAAGAGIEKFCIVVCPGYEKAYAEACGEFQSRTEFAVQPEPRGYGDAILCGRSLMGVVGVTKTEPLRELVWESRKDPDHERQEIHD